MLSLLFLARGGENQSAVMLTEGTENKQNKYWVSTYNTHNIRPTAIKGSAHPNYKKFSRYVSFQKQCPGLLSIFHRPHDERFTLDLLSTEETVLMNTVDSIFCVFSKVTATRLWTFSPASHVSLGNYWMDCPETVCRQNSGFWPSSCKNNDIIRWGTW